MKINCLGCSINDCIIFCIFCFFFCCTAAREAGVWVHSLAGPLPPLFIFHLPIPSQTPCWWWLGFSCSLWNGLQAAWPSSPPELRDWGVASRETAGTSGPTLSSSWLTTRMLSWVGWHISLFLMASFWLCLLSLWVLFVLVEFNDLCPIVLCALCGYLLQCSLIFPPQWNIN